MTGRQFYDWQTAGGGGDVLKLIEVLERQEISWCAIGGLAVNCYVEPVYTVDADIVVVAEKLAAIADELATAGFRLEQFAHSLNARKPDGKLNVQFTQDPRYQDFLARAKPREVLGQTVPVADIKDIVRGKVWAWSDGQRRLSKHKKDELDLIRIGEAHPELWRDMPREIVSQLEGGGA